MWVAMTSSHSVVRARLSPLAKCLVYCVLGLPGHLWGNCVPRIWNYVWKTIGPSHWPHWVICPLSLLMETSWLFGEFWWHCGWLSGVLWRAIGWDQRGRHHGPGRRVQHWLVLKAWEVLRLFSWFGVPASAQTLALASASIPAPAMLYIWIALWLAHPRGLTSPLSHRGLWGLSPTVGMGYCIPWKFKHVCQTFEGRLQGHEDIRSSDSLAFSWQFSHLPYSTDESVHLQGFFGFSFLSLL